MKKLAVCCQVPCWFDDEFCWGKIILSDSTENGTWIHECQGHIGMSSDGRYNKQFQTRSHLFLNRKV